MCFIQLPGSDIYFARNISGIFDAKNGCRPLKIRVFGRSGGADILSSKINYFSTVFCKRDIITSALEFGSNIGLNERALLTLFPSIKIETVEINEEAAEECQKVPNTIVHVGSFLEFETDKTFDLTLCNGVLIHTNPECLGVMYKKLYQYSKKYVLIGEYYNPTPVEVSYRGYDGKLFKRDFAGEFMDMFPEVKLLDYGFRYHRDRAFLGDDSTWFLFEK